MANDNFKMHNYIRQNHAEADNSVNVLKPFYKILIWLPMILIGLYAIVGIIIFAVLEIEVLYKIFIILGIIIEATILVVIILVLQAYERLMMYHMERTNYNTSKINYQLDLIISSMNIEEKSNVSSTASTKTIPVNNNNILNEEFMKAKNGIEAMLNDKIINDKQFDIYIKMLQNLGGYNNSNELINLYKIKYDKIKNVNTKNLNVIYDELLLQIADLYNSNKINKEKYDEYVSILNNISDMKDSFEQEKAYKKLKIILSMY